MEKYARLYIEIPSLFYKIVAKSLLLVDDNYEIVNDILYYYLTKDQYDSQMMNPDFSWKIPGFAEPAIFDNEYFEKLHPDQ